MHNEQAYLHQDADPSYPRKIFFCCLQPAASGGQTPILLNRDFHAALGALPQRFAAVIAQATTLLLLIYGPILSF